MRFEGYGGGRELGKLKHLEVQTYSCGKESGCMVRLLYGSIVAPTGRKAGYRVILWYVHNQPISFSLSSKISFSIDRTCLCFYYCFL